MFGIARHWKPVLSSLAALVVPAVLVWFGAAAMAASPSPKAAKSPAATTSSATSGSATGGNGSKATGNASRGAQLYQQNCTQCHGADLSGGVGPKLDPITKIDNISNPLDPKYLTDTITNGRSGEAGKMPPKGGNDSLTAADVQDLVAFIIAQNKQNPGGNINSRDLAVSNVQMVTLGILALLLLTYLLSRYNMRWIARRSRR